MCSRSIKFVLASAVLCLPTLALAQTPASAPATQAQVAALQQAVQNAQSNADNAWMLISAALVLMMTGPGLALFYGGLVRRKNVLATMMQSFVLMAVVTIVWAIVRLLLAFGHGNSFIGGFEHRVPARREPRAQPDYAATIPDADLHGLPAHVCHHHPGAHQRRVCRAHEVQRHGRVLVALAR